MSFNLLWRTKHDQSPQLNLKEKQKNVTFLIQGLDFNPGYKDVSPRYKARLVAYGYTQIYGIYYLYTYLLVVRHYSIRLVLAITASRDLNTIQLDIKTTFFSRELGE